MPIKDAYIQTVTVCCFVFLSVLSYTETVSAETVNVEKGNVDFWPFAEYAKQVPSLKSVLGYDHGERISAPDQVVKYLDVLSSANPERSMLVNYGETWEGRPLVYIVISSKENMASLSIIQAQMQLLANPENLDQAKIDTLIATTPPVSWMSYGVHGDEISSSDAAMLTAYHLLASKNSDIVSNILESSIVVIDPSQNPDGRSRFVEHFRQIVGLEPSEHQLAAEHLQAWPGGRTNHYLFDMNRDWFAMTQPEVQGRIEHYLKFQPVVHVDIHEMGPDNSYYFPPPTEPFNPYITADQKKNLNLYGKGNAAAFDKFKFDYFTREVFDAYYPGYGDTWPGFHGAIGMTFEMASARGLATLRLDGRVLTYRDGVHRHFISSLATLKTTAENRGSLLQDFTAFRQSAMQSKQNFIVAGGDQSLQTKMISLLSKQGIDVYQTTKQSKLCGTTYKSDTYVIPAGQAAGRLVETLLGNENAINDEVWQEQERRRKAGLQVEFYDVLAWSLPAIFNLEVDTCKGSLRNLAKYTPNKKIEMPSFAKAELAYLLPWGTQSAVKFLSHALRGDIVVHSADKAFTFGQREFAKGTLIFKVKGNGQILHEELTRLSKLTKVEVVPVDSSWTSKGINFGSRHVKRLYKPKVAIAWDRPTVSYAAGNTRFVIEQQLGFPVTPIRTRHLSEPELEDFNVLIMPDAASYSGVLGKAGEANISAWVANGGTLITLGRASRLLLDSGLDLLDTDLESRGDETSDEDEEDDIDLVEATFLESLDDYNEVILNTESKPDYIPGVILRGKTNQDHWLSGGVEEGLNFMVIGSDVYSPLVLGKGVNIVKFAGEENLVVSGALWSENKSQLAHKPIVMADTIGRGQVIAFTSDPAFRGYMDGLNVLLANAILKGPAHTRYR